MTPDATLTLFVLGGLIFVLAKDLAGPAQSFVAASRLSGFWRERACRFGDRFKIAD